MTEPEVWDTDDDNTTHFRGGGKTALLCIEGMYKNQKKNGFLAFFLLIRSGAFAYEELMKRAEAQMQRVEALYERSPLPDTPDAETSKRILVQIRKAFYNGT